MTNYEKFNSSLKSFRIFCDTLSSVNRSKNLIIESSDNAIELKVQNGKKIIFNNDIVFNETSAMNLNNKPLTGLNSITCNNVDLFNIFSTSNINITNKASFSNFSFETTNNEIQDLRDSFYNIINLYNNSSVIVDINATLSCSYSLNERITIELWRDLSMISKSNNLGSVNAVGGIPIPFSLTYFDTNLSSGDKKYYLKYKLENNTLVSQGIINVNTSESGSTSNIILREIVNASNYSNKTIFDSTKFVTTSYEIQDLSTVFYNIINVANSDVQININVNLYCCYDYNERISVEVWRDSSMISQSKELGTVNATAGLTIPYSFNYLDKNAGNGDKKYYLKYKLEKDVSNNNSNSIEEQGLVNINTLDSSGSSVILLANVAKNNNNLSTASTHSFLTTTSDLQDLSSILYNNIDVNSPSAILVDLNITLFACYASDERITVELWRDSTMISNNLNIGPINATGGLTIDFRLSLLDETVDAGRTKYYLKYKLESNLSARAQGIVNVRGTYNIIENFNRGISYKVLSYKNMNSGYVLNTKIGYAPSIINDKGSAIGRRDAYFTYIDISGADSLFNNSLYVKNNISVGGSATIRDDFTVRNITLNNIYNSLNIIKDIVYNTVSNIKYDTQFSVAITNLNGSTSDALGSSVAINKEGNIIALVAPGPINNLDSGFVRIYKYNDISWVKISQDISGASSVSLNSAGNIIGIGKRAATGFIGQVQVYRYANNNNWVIISQTILGNVVGDKFGRAISLNSAGTIVAIGSPNSNANGYLSGSVNAYKYIIDGSWVPMGQTIVGETTNSSSGHSLSLDSSGTILAIGAITNINAAGESGQVRVYRFTNDVSWVLISQDIDGTTSNAGFGYSVSLNSAGTLVACGATATSASGYVKVYEYISDGSWIPQGQTINGEAYNDYYGLSVSLNNQGNILAVGAPYNDGSANSAGHVRVYKYNDVSWIQITRDIEGDLEYEQLGYYVALNGIGTRLVAGAPGGYSGRGYAKVYDVSSLPPIIETPLIYRKLGETITNPTLNRMVGSNISTNDEGNIIAIGSNSEYQTGIINIYKYNEIFVTWEKIGQNISPGRVMSLNSSGNIIAIADEQIASATGRVQVYKYVNDNSWIQISQNIFGLSSAHYFGRSLSLNSEGTILAIGAYYANTTNGSNSGSVSVYKHIIDGSWVPMGQTINGETGGSHAGWSVSLDSSGTILAIGAVNNVNAAGQSGQVRVYRFINDVSWILISQDIDGTTSNDGFGYSVSLNGDGTLVACGATATSASGYVKVYEYISDGSWIPQGQTISGEAYNDYSGYSVSLNNQGNILAIGAPYNDGSANTTNVGHVRVYKYNDVSWIQIDTDIEGNTSNENFGYVVALNGLGSRLFVGAPGGYNSGGYSGFVKVYDVTYPPPIIDSTLNIQIYKRISETITNTTPNNNMGSNISTNDEGNIIAIGSNAEYQTGIIKIYKYNDVSWVQIGQNITPGRVMSLNSSGNIIAVADEQISVYTGRVQLYKYVNDYSWVQISQNILGVNTYDYFGNSLSLNSEGTIVAIGSPTVAVSNINTGSVSVYTHIIDGSWVPLGQIIVGEAGAGYAGGSYTGWSVSLDSSGTILAIGAIYNVNAAGQSGQVRVYRFTNDVSWILISQDIDGTTSNDSFGYSVSLNGDGTLVASGATAGGSTGYVKVYKYISDGSWIQQGQTINGEAYNDYSGYSVSLNKQGNILAIGAPYEHAINSGHVRVYKFNGVKWIQIATDIDGTSGNERLGSAVAINGLGNRLFVGVPGGYISSAYSGYVNIYDISSLNIIIDTPPVEIVDTDTTFTINSIVAGDLSATNITISNELYVYNKYYMNNLSIRGQILSNVLKVPSIFTIDPFQYNNNSGTLAINGDVLIKGNKTQLGSTIVDISGFTLKFANNLLNISDLLTNPAGFDVSNNASLKYNGVKWNFNGEKLLVGSTIVGYDVSLVNLQTNIYASLATSKSIYTISFGLLQINIDSSFNDVYTKSSLNNSFVTKLNADNSYIILKNSIAGSFLLKQTYNISENNMLQNYAIKANIDESLTNINRKIDLSFVLQNILELSYNDLKNQFEASFNNIVLKKFDVDVSTIYVETIKTNELALCSNVTISGDLIVTGDMSINSLNISNTYIFNSNGYSSIYLNDSNNGSIIEEYYSNFNNYGKVIYINADGSLYSQSGKGALSDSRLKECIVDVAPKLQDLLKVRVIDYNLNNNPTEKYIGVLAQELEKIFPGLVSDNAPSAKEIEYGKTENYKSVKYSCFNVMLIKALQEQQENITNLSLRLERLKHKRRIYI